jgi:hypothetical protein
LWPKLRILLHDKITSMKKPEFPNTIKEGHSKAIIYRYANRDSISYTVVWYEGEVRKRRCSRT